MKVFSPVNVLDKLDMINLHNIDERFNFDREEIDYLIDLVTEDITRVN